MLKIAIKNLTEGEHSFALTAPAETVAFLAPEFIGTITCDGVIAKSGRQYLVKATASGKALLTCDISGEQYESIISTDLDLAYFMDNARFHEQQIVEDPEPPYFIHEEEKELDLTEEIRQELSVALPMKRVAPQYEGKEFADIFPQFTGDEQPSDDANAPIDERWAALKKLKF